MAPSDDTSSCPPLHVYLYGDNKLRGTLFFQVNRHIRETAPLKRQLLELRGVHRTFTKLYHHNGETMVELRFQYFDYMLPVFGNLARTLADGLTIPYASTFLHRNLFDTAPLALPEFVERVMPDQPLVGVLSTNLEAELLDLELEFAGSDFRDSEDT